MTLFQYLNTLPIGFSEKNTISCIIRGYDSSNGQPNVHSFVSKSKKYILPEGFKIDENYLDLMEQVNRMVKHESCPHNLKNRFYDYKTRLIKECIKEGRVTDVYDEGTCISLIIDGKYRFHQLKDSYAGKHLVCEGTREYNNEETPLEFDYEVYKKFQMSAILYIGTQRKKRFGGIDEPKNNNAYYESTSK